MAMTGAERQRKYREKIKAETDRNKKKRRLDLLVSERAWVYLDSLSSSHGYDKGDFLEKLILQAYSEHSQRLFKLFMK